MKEYIVKLGIAFLIISIIISFNKENEFESLVILEYNSSYSINDGEYTLRFDSVLNDTRCPTGLECFWAGNAEIRINLISDENIHSFFQLNSGLQPNDTVIQGYRIKMVKLSPYPIADESIDQKDYKVELLIKKE